MRLGNALVTSALLGAVSVIWLGTAASATTLISENDPKFGSGAITLDVSTGIEWLAPKYSLDRSYTDVSGQFGAGGDFEGYRYASNAEITSLFVSVGGVVVDDYTPLNSLAVTTLQNFLGVTESESFINRLAGYTGDAYPGIPNTEYIFQFNVDPSNGFGEFRDFTVDDKGTPLNFGGNFLVKNVSAVPEPNVWALIILGFGAVGFRLRSARVKRTFPQVA
ncbi:MAG: PEP-CTERM sorting domain-containing protein [Pseudomonadota bacterium]